MNFVILLKLAMILTVVNSRTLDVLICIPSEEGNEYDNPFALTSLKVNPVVDTALIDIYSNLKILPRDTLRINFADTNKTSITDALLRNQLDLILGFGNRHDLAQVARASWCYKNGTGVPVITTTGPDEILDKKNEYKLLTRMGGTYKDLSFVFHKFAQDMKWNRFAYLVQSNLKHGRTLGHTECYYQLLGIRRYHMEQIRLNNMTTGNNFAVVEEFDPLVSSDWKTLLKNVSMMSNIILICGSPDTVRDVMLSAHSMGMTKSGKYAFVNLQLFTYAGTKPWFNTNDTDANNELAREAFRALKILSLRKPRTLEFGYFESRISTMALTGRPDQLSPYIGAFYDSLLLYSLAVNESLSQIELTGNAITQRMWNRTFSGIGGNVSINSNGDRQMEYCIYEYDPTTRLFQENAHCRPPEYRWIQSDPWYWVTGEPVKDSPVCGYDNSKCHKSTK